MGHLFSKDWPVSASREKFIGGFDHVNLIFFPYFISIAYFTAGVNGAHDWKDCFLSVDPKRMG